MGSLTMPDALSIFIWLTIDHPFQRASTVAGVALSSFGDVLNHEVLVVDENGMIIDLLACIGILALAPFDLLNRSRQKRRAHFLHRPRLNLFIAQVKPGKGPTCSAELTKVARQRDARKLFLKVSLKAAAVFRRMKNAIHVVEDIDLVHVKSFVAAGNL